MKRDKSLLFTAVPEEDINMSSSSSPDSVKTVAMMTLQENLESKLPIMPDVVPFSNKPRIRPNKLSLSFKNSVSRDSIDENIAEMKFEPTFTGQTSVCSTPMLEFKHLHGNVMSICRASNEKILNESLNMPYISNNEDIRSPPDEFKCIDDEPVQTKTAQCKDFTTTEQFIPMPEEKFRKFNSLSDINGGFKRISQLAAMRFGGSVAKKNTNKTLSLNADDSPVEDTDELKTSVTITDPHYPVFRNDGVPISKSLFDEYLCQQYSNKPVDMSKNITKAISKPSKEHFEGFDSEIVLSPLGKKQEVVSSEQIKLESEKADPSRRKSLTLPLKSLGGDKVATNEPSSQSQPGPFFESHRKKLSGVQLTPLMEKLSHLAFSEKSSGYSSRGITPMEFKDFALSTPCIEKTTNFPTENKRYTSFDTG